ncbi:MAG: hypothetical protein JRC86_03180 [Deltaproteobacteria bacterium]|nr:hypothetical protein [Deltaproteobacteria bacterium]
MKVGRNIKDVIRKQINIAISCARGIHSKCTHASLDIYRAKEKKIFKLTATQVAKVEKRLLSEGSISVPEIRSPMQTKFADKAWKEHKAREASSAKKQNKIINRIQDLDTAIMADLELCCCEDEQRAVVAKFAKHDITKPWKIQAAEHRCPVAK